MNKIDLELEQNLLEENTNWVKWSTQIEATRYPLATHTKSKGEEHIKSLPWPKRSEVRIVRRGDQTGVELKLFAQNNTELRTQVDSLNAVVKEIEKQDLKSF